MLMMCLRLCVQLPVSSLLSCLNVKSWPFSDCCFPYLSMFWIIVVMLSTKRSFIKDLPRNSLVWLQLGGSM